jgi:hypothetical protein
MCFFQWLIGGFNKSDSLFHHKYKIYYPRNVRFGMLKCLVDSLLKKLVESHQFLFTDVTLNLILLASLR